MATTKTIYDQSGVPITVETADYDRWQSWYNDYMQRIEQYKGTEYYDRLLNNPYISFQQFNPSAMGKLDKFFGGTDGSAAFYNDRENNANEYLAGILSEIQQNSRNSTSQQVARDQAAGFNDSLTGQVANGTPAATPQDDAAPPSPGVTGAEAAESASSFANAGMNFISGIIGLAQSLQSMGLMSVQKSAALTSLSDNVYNFTLKTTADELGLPEIGPDGKYDYSQVSDKVLEAVTKSAKRASPFGNRRADKLYRQMRGRITFDKEGRPTSALQRAWSENLNKTSQNLTEAAKNAALPGFSFDADDFGSFVKSVGDSLVNYQLKLVELEAKVAENDAIISELQAKAAPTLIGAETAEANYYTDMYNAADGTLAGETMNDENEMRKAIANHQKLVNEFHGIQMEFKKEMLEKIRGEDHWWNKLGMLTLPGLLDNADQLLPGALRTLGNVAGTVASKYGGGLAAGAAKAAIRAAGRK